MNHSSVPAPDHDGGPAHDAARILTRRRLLGLFGGAMGSALLAGCGSSHSAAAPVSAPMAAAAPPSIPVSGDVPPGPAPTATPSGGPPPPGMNLLEQPDQSATPVPKGTIPEEPDGPYPADGTNGPNVLNQPGADRTDIRSSFGGSTTTAEGVPMKVRLTVTDHQQGGIPYDGAAVYLWQCNRDGDYSMYGQNLAGENYLRGVGVVYSDGVVEFTSIFPGAEVGRWPHLNIAVYLDLEHAGDGGERLRTTQIALPEQACKEVYASPGYEQSASRLSQITLDTDPVFKNGYSLELAKASGSASNGYLVELAVPV
ncbi:MAG TPA: hypothetical protein VE081_10295 [Sporichthyaceae bacterium]|nr:hypothetical protein [Sporichthyaceae bacterium]